MIGMNYGGRGAPSHSIKPAKVHRWWHMKAVDAAHAVVIHASTILPHTLVSSSLQTPMSPLHTTPRAPPAHDAARAITFVPHKAANGAVLYAPHSCTFCIPQHCYVAALES